MAAHRHSYRTPFEPLEKRSLMSATLFDQTNLVSDQFGIAQIQDKNLVGPNGLTFNPTSGAFWVANNGSGKATLYTGDLKNGSIAKAPLVVSIPQGEPTGAVANITNDFVVTAKNGQSGPAKFIFASENGNITGWNPAVPTPAPSISAQQAAHVNGASFTGLTMGASGGQNFIYAADNAGGKIDVFDGKFKLTTLSGSFKDSNIPQGFEPLNIKNLRGNLFVTYVQHDNGHSSRSVLDTPKGFVDEFDTSGHLIRRIASGGLLNEPMGLAIAPKAFGSFGGDLLVGNLADGRITAFDPTKNFASAGQLKNADGRTIAIDGLASLQFGNGVSAGDTSALYFTAGPGASNRSLFGSIRVARNITVTPFADGTNADLSVEGRGDTNQLSIIDDTVADTTTVITDGRTQVFDRLFSQINIQLHGKHSHMTLDLAGTTVISANEL